MGICIVVVDQQPAGAVVWTACTPNLIDLGLAKVDAPLGVDCFPLLEQNSGHRAEFGEEDYDHL